MDCYQLLEPTLTFHLVAITWGQFTGNVQVKYHQHEVENNWLKVIWGWVFYIWYYGDVLMSAMVSQITNLTIVCATIYSGVDQRKHQSSVSLAFVWGIHRRPVNSPHKGPVARKMFPFDDLIMGKCFLVVILTWKNTSNEFDQSIDE